MKTCIFDLDGTLTDTLESLAFSVKETLKEMGLPQITTDECRSFVGNGSEISDGTFPGRQLEIGNFQELRKEWRYTDVYLMKTVHIL